jgi:hypothetical protein
MIIRWESWSSTIDECAKKPYICMKHIWCYRAHLFSHTIKSMFLSDVCRSIYYNFITEFSPWNYRVIIRYQVKSESKSKKIWVCRFLVTIKWLKSCFSIFVHVQWGCQILAVKSSGLGQTKGWGFKKTSIHRPLVTKENWSLGQNSCSLVYGSLLQFFSRRLSSKHYRMVHAKSVVQAHDP